MRRPRDLVERVGALVMEVSATAIEPRFRGAGEVGGVSREKSPGEWVTEADDEGEHLLTDGLMAMWPDVPVVGEEACAADPGQLAALHADRCWLVDPLDGTANFVDGSTDWAVMVALIERGAAVASWMWQPHTRRMYVAEHGAGAMCNGTPIRCWPRLPDATDLRGAVLRRFLEPATAAAVERNVPRFAHVGTGRFCSGYEYPDVVEGGQDFVVFWRTLPWDHAPGVLLVEEAGGHAARPDGTPYRPTDPPDQRGLVVAADTATWRQARTLLD